MDNPITRRRAIQSGGFAAITAALAGSTTGPIVAKTDPPGSINVTATVLAPMLAKVVNADDLAAEAHRRWDDVKAAMSRVVEVQDEMRDRLDWGALNSLSVAESNYSEAHSTWVLAELARHLPGLAPVILLLENHIITTAYQKPGACCTVAKGFEP